MNSSLKDLQNSVVSADSTLFVLGPAGSGKTTALQQRILRLLNEGEPAYTILVLVADPRHRQSYSRFVQQQGIPFSDLKVVHYPQLAQEMVTLFWPLVARSAGFASGFRPPTYLGYDLAQLLMWRIVTPLLHSGAFADLRRRPQQIISQLLDTLNRSALNNLDVLEATQRQIETWTGEKNHIYNLEQAQVAATDFRNYCLKNNLLDLSLTIETFNKSIVRTQEENSRGEFFSYFKERFRHLIVDNVEEQTPAGQAFIAKLMDQTISTTIAYDEGGGYRSFLAADPHGSNKFRTQSRHFFYFNSAISTIPPSVKRLATVVDHYLNGSPPPSAESSTIQPAITHVIKTRYRREMIFSLAQYLAQLIHRDGVPPSEIAIVIPYLDEAMRYMLVQALKEEGLPMNFVRRRGIPNEEPQVRAWLTWVALAHPLWNTLPTQYDVAEALSLSIESFDPVRSALIAHDLFPKNTMQLLSAERLLPTNIARIGTERISLYEKLRVWLEKNGNQHRLDHFIYKLFTELLSAESFQPTPHIDHAAICDWLVRTAERLCKAAPALGLTTNDSIGRAFLTSIRNGLVTSQPPDTGDPPDPNGISISTIYGYLLGGNPVRYQVWLETGASGWWDIPRQPLNNRFVLAESWDATQRWTMVEELAVRNELLTRIVQGLVGRCHEGVILATSDLDRRGQRQDGPLWRAFEATNTLPTLSKGNSAEF